MVNGQKLEYVASKSESVKSLRTLLNIRNRYMKVLDIPNRDWRGNPTVLSPQQRDQLLDLWKKDFHGQPRQEAMHMRDSWKPRKQRKGGPSSGGAVQPTAGKGMQKGKQGPNKEAVKAGKHSRFSRHLQREFGVMNLALAIVFTGDVDVNRLQAAQASQPGASQPGDSKAKSLARVAKFRRKQGRLLEKQMNRFRDPFEKERQESALGPEQRRLLEDFRSGRALYFQNEAVKAWGHGRLHGESGEYLDIGGSTGGLARQFMGDDINPDVEAWMQQAGPRQRQAASSSLGAVPKRQ